MSRAVQPPATSRCHRNLAGTHSNISARLAHRFLFFHRHLIRQYHLLVRECSHEARQADDCTSILPSMRDTSIVLIILAKYEYLDIENVALRLGEETLTERKHGMETKTVLQLALQARLLPCNGSGVKHSI